MRSLVVTLFLFGFIAVAQSQGNSVLVPLKPNQVYQYADVKIPSFNFKSLEPLLHNTNDITYVINFWATWCLPCVKELPYFEQLNQKYKDQKVKVILISMDMPNKVESTLIPFVKKKNLQSQVLHLDDPDANAWIEKVDANWSGAIPATLIYNANQRKFYERSFTYEDLEKELVTIINN